MKAGWAVKTIGEVADHCLGKMLDKSKNRGTPKPYLRNLNVRWFGFDLRDVLEMKFEDDETHRYSIRRGDVAVCEGGYPGRAAIWENDEPIFIQKAIHRVRFHEPERARWFIYYLSYCDAAGTLRDHFSGSGIQHFTGQALAKFRLPIPPLEEQRRIVAVLDEAFEGLDRARANAEANLASARELLSNAIDTLMTSEGHGAMRTLGQLCKFENGDRGKNYPGRKAFVSTGVPFINAGHLLNGPIDWGNMNFIPADHFSRLSNGKVRKGDLLFCLRGSLGKFGSVDNDEPGAIASSLVIVRPGAQLIGSYLAAYFESRKCAEMIKKFGNGAAQPNLSAKNLASFEISLPSVDQQLKVIDAVAKIRQSADALVQTYETKLNDFADLRQSLLRKAFAGELT